MLHGRDLEIHVTAGADIAERTCESIHRYSVTDKSLTREALPMQWQSGGSLRALRLVKDEHVD